LGAHIGLSPSINVATPTLVAREGSLDGMMEVGHIEDTRRVRTVGGKMQGGGKIGRA